MHDFVTMAKMSDQQLQDMLMTIERKLGCPMNEAAFQLMNQQRDYIMAELQERQQMASLRIPPLPSMSLTDDDLSRKEKASEEKNPQPKN